MKEAEICRTEELRGTCCVGKC